MVKVLNSPARYDNISYFLSTQGTWVGGQVRVDKEFGLLQVAHLSCSVRGPATLSVTVPLGWFSN